MKLQEIKEEAASLIIEAAKFSAIVGVLATDFDIKISASLYLNIRDAMFHFRALVDYEKAYLSENNAQEKEEYKEKCLKHSSNLQEHITRGEKDAIISFAQTVIDCLYQLIDSEDYKELAKEEKEQLQKWYHKIKGIILRIRISGIEMVETEENKIETIWKELSNYTLQINSLLKQKGLRLF